MDGTPAKLPLQLCPCGACGIAVDAAHRTVFENGHSSAQIHWDDVLNDPAWGPKGYPTGGGGASHVTVVASAGGRGGAGYAGPPRFVSVDLGDYLPETVRSPSAAPAPRCECGAEKTYGAGATHSSWCAKAGV